MIGDRPVARAGLWAVIVILATYRALFGGGYMMASASGIRLADHLLAAAVILLWLGAALARPDWDLLPRTRLWPVIVACLAAFAISTATSWSPRLSIEMLGYAILLALLYLLLVGLMRSPFLRPRLAGLAALLALAVCAWYLADTLLLWRQWWDLVGRLAIPPLRPAYDGLAYGSPNIVATMALLLGGMGAAAIGVDSRGAIAASAGLVILVAAAVFISGSRGAWLGMGAGLVAVAGAFLVRPAHRERLRTAFGRLAPPVRILVGVLAIAAVGAAAYAARSRLTLEDSGLRATFTAVSARMFGASPLTGLGPGTWAVERASFTRPQELDFWNPHAQSIYIQTVGEFGILGIVAGVILAAGLLWLLRDGLRSADARRRQVAYAAAFAVTLLAVQQTVDFFANLPAVLFAFALPIAYLDGTAEAESPWARWLRRLFPPSRLAARALTAGAMVAVLVTALGLWRIESVAAQAERGVAMANAGDWAGAFEPLHAAATRDPDIALYQFQFGLAAASAGHDAQARIALRKAATGDDYAIAWVDLAAEDLAAGDTAAARDDLIRGERLGWQSPDAMVAAASIRARLGDSELALTDAADAVASTPILAADTAGWATVLPGVPMQRIVDRALQRLEDRRRGGNDLVIDTGRAFIGIFARRPDVMAAATSGLIADGASPETVSSLRLAASAWAGDATAATALRAASEQHPTDGRAVGFSALLADRAGTEDLAARLRTWQLIVDPFAATSGAWPLSIGPWEAAPQRQGVPTGQHASAYRRPPLDTLISRRLPIVAQP